MTKVGITGGIGSGKSVVAELLKVHGVPVYIADVESKWLTATSPVIRRGLVGLLGKEVYTPEGLNRAFLASRIFSDASLLQQVNAIIHPEVSRHYLAWMEKQDSPVTALESAILFESGFDSLVDVRLMVYAPREVRIQRAMKREKASREEIVRRIENQMDDESKKERADYVIYNDGKQALIPQLQLFLQSLHS